MRIRCLGALAFIGILLSSGLAYPASYAQSEIVLSLDKHLYTVGESVVLLGLVKSPSNIPVIVQVWNPKNEACSFQEVSVNDDGTFSAEPVLLAGRICGDLGTYTIKAFYGEFEGSITFEVRTQSPTKEIDGRLETLLSILKKAKESVDDKISDLKAEGIEIPGDIMLAYDDGISELRSTEMAVEADDLDSATQHMKNAMKSFRKVFGALVALGQEEAREAAEAPAKEQEISRLRQAISRMLAFKDKLTTTAASNDITIPESTLRDFDSAVEESLSSLEKNDASAAAKSLAKARHILDDVHKLLIQEGKKQKLDRIEHFVEETIERIDRMIAEAESLGLSQEVIDSLEEAKREISDAKSIGDVRKISAKIKSKHHELSVHKGKNLEKVLENLQSQLEESKAEAERLGLSLNVYARIESMVDDAIAKSRAGEISAAVDILERSARIIKEVTKKLDKIKERFQELESLENRASQLMAEHGDDPEILDAIGKASHLIESARDMLMNAMSKKDLKMADSMIKQADRILDKIRD